MGLTLSETQERDIDETVNLIFTSVARMKSARLGRRRATVEKARCALREWTQHYNDGGARDHRTDVTSGGLGGLFFTAESYFLAFDITRLDPDDLTDMGREAVTAGMRGCVEHYEHALSLARVMMAEAGNKYITLRAMVEAGLALVELAKQDPQMGMVGPGVEIYHRTLWNDDGEFDGKLDLDPVLTTLHEMLNLAGQD